MSLPRMSLHIGDYKKATGHLRAAGHGAYFLLILHYWATGGLPDDDEQLAAIACMTDREWKKHKPVIKAFFKDGNWKHRRIDEELIEAQARYEKRASAGKKGGDAKAKGKQTPSNATANAYQPITDNREDGGGGDAREPLVSDAAHSLAAEIAAIAGYPEPIDWPPGWCGAPMRVQTWLNEGWPREVILVAVRESMGRKRDGPPDTVNYFEKAVARAVARQSAPLPKVVTDSSPEVIHAQADQRHPGGAYGASKDRGRAAHAELKAFLAEPGSGERGGSAVELLPAARRE